MRLRLAVGQLQPILLRLAEEVIDGPAMLRVDRLVLQEEAAAIQVQRDRGREVVLVFVAVFEDALIDLVDPSVQPAQRLDGQGGVDVDVQVTQSSEAGRDVQRDVVVAPPAGEPRPRTVGELHLG